MSFSIVLFQPEIPANTGNIARLCVGLDCELHLIEPLGFHIDDKAVQRAGLDYWPHLKLHTHSHIEQLLSRRSIFLSKSGSHPYWEHKFEPGDQLIFGSETAGLPEQLRTAEHDRLYHIPMPGPVRSLNLSNAVSLVAYEGMRQLAVQGRSDRPRPNPYLPGHTDSGTGRSL